MYFVVDIQASENHVDKLSHKIITQKYFSLHKMQTIQHIPSTHTTIENIVTVASV